MHVTYGGTFDPVHIGHVAVARSVARQLGEPVHLVPAADPRHRAPPGASAQQRLRMLELAVQGDACLRVDARELRRAGATYTVDTLRELRDELGAGTPIACVIGADAFRGLPTWKAWTQLFELAHLIVMTRPEHTLADLPLPLESECRARHIESPSALERSAAGAVLSLQVPAVDVSSTAVRAAVAAGLPIDALVPEAVQEFILTQRLYR